MAVVVQLALAAMLTLLVIYSRTYGSIGEHGVRQTSPGLASGSSNGYAHFPGLGVTRMLGSSVELGKPHGSRAWSTLTALQLDPNSMNLPGIWGGKKRAFYVMVRSSRRKPVRE